MSQASSGATAWYWASRAYPYWSRGKKETGLVLEVKYLLLNQLGFCKKKNL